MTPMYPDPDELEYIEDEAFFHPSTWEYLNREMAFSVLLPLLQRRRDRSLWINWGADFTRSERRTAIAAAVAA